MSQFIYSGALLLPTRYSGGTAAPWTYLDIPSSKVVAVLDPDVGVDTIAKTWTDAVHGVVFSAASSLVMDSSGLNGQKRVTFGGTSATSLTGTIPAIATGKAQAFAVGKIASGAAGGALWSISGAAFGQLFPFTDGNIYENFGTDTRYSGVAAIGTGALSFAYEVNADNAGNWVARLNGSDVSTKTDNTVAWSTSVLIGDDGSSFFLNGEIDFMMLLSDNLSTDEETKMRAYIMSRWGLAA